MTSSNAFDNFYNNNERLIQYAPSQNLGENYNVFDRYYEAEAKQRDKELRILLNSAAQNDPDGTGEAQRLAKELNLPDGMVINSDETLDYLKERARQQDIEARKLAMVNPVLARQLRDPNFAAIAYDNIPRLASNENIFQSIASVPEDAWQGIRKGVLSREMGFIAQRFKNNNVQFKDLETGFDLNYVPTEQDIKDYERLKQISETINNFDSDGVGLIEGASYFVGQFGSSIPEAALTGYATWQAKTLAGAGIGFLVPDGPIMFGGEAVGATIGNFVGLFTGWNAFQNKLAYDTYMVEGGHSWLELREKGYGINEAKVIANTVGGTNALIERYGLSLIAPKYSGALSSVKGMFTRSGLAKTPFAKALQKRLFRQTAKSALSKSGLKLTYNAATREFLKDYVTVLGTETGQELAQEMVAIAGVNLFADLSEKEIQTISAEEIGDRIFSTLTETMKGMILFGLIGPGMTYSNNWSKASRARNTTSVLEKLTQITKDDKTKIRNPDKYGDYTQALADQAGITDFYFDANTFQQQLDNNQITNEQLEMFSPELYKELQNAKKEGSVGKLVKIPTGKYMANISGTNLGNSLFPHLKVGEKEYSQTEMAEFFKDQPELLAAAREATNQAKTELLEFQSESRLVKKQIAKQLRNAGYIAKEARDMAALPQAFAEAFARRLGIKPLEFLNQYQYNIQRDTPDRKSFNAQFFNQDGTIKTETDLFKNWFRKSKLTNSDGTPQVLYHGTTDSFDHFDLNHPNRYDSGFAGTGVYLTPNEGLAKIYTMNKSIRAKGEKKIMKLYARLENPKIENIDIKPDMMRGGRAKADAYRDKLISEGFDGVTLVNDAGEVVEVVIFDVNGVKSIDNNGNWSTEINNIYEQQALETFEQKATQKQGKPVPQALYQISNLRESFDFAKGKTYNTNRDFKLALQERVIKEAKKAKVDVKEFTAEVEKYLVQTVLEDAKFALEENANAVGWYNEKVTKAKALLSLIHPELATNSEANFAFTWALANTSNGIKVDKNFELAEQAYSYWVENGEFPTNIGIGDASDAINRNFKLYNRLIKEKGFKEFEQFMKTTHTVKEVEAYTNDEVSGETQGEIVYGAAVMGPKIGNGFFANLYGNYEQLTMDRWLMRTWGRMRGELVIDYSKQAKVKRGQLKELIKALSLQEKKLLSEIIGVKVKLSNLDEVGVAIQKASTKKANRARMNEIATVLEKPERKQFLLDLLGKPQKRYPHISLGGEIRKGGNALAKYLDGQKEAPSGAPERRNIRKVFSQVLAELQQTEKDLTMADLQALLWYPERRLYDAAKLDSQETNTGYEDNEAPDYANAAEALARQQGVLDADIQTTLQEVDNELKRQATIGTRGSESGEGGTGGVREIDTFQQQRNIDEATGLPINPDGTVTVYHHTNRRAAESIKATGQLRSAGEPDVYVTTRAIADTGYGDTAVAIRVEPSRLSLDDEFPNGRRDFRLNVGKPRGSIQVKTGEFLEQQAFDGPRGRFDPSTLTTLLTQKADFSTFAHETAHYMLTVLENIVSTDTAPPELIADFDTLLQFWGVKDLKTWQSFDLNQKRKYHESFAYNFELYLFEKKAPSKGLQKLFRQFARFIKDVYQDVSTRLNDLYRRETGQDLPMLTNEVRSVMDRMLATDEQIIQAEQIYDMKAMFQTQEQSGMNDVQWAEYTAALNEAEEETLEIMSQQSMRQVRWIGNKRNLQTKEFNKQIEKLYKIEQAEVTKEVLQDKRYKALLFLKRGETVNDQGEKIKVEGKYKISKNSLQKLVPFYDMATEIKQLGTGKYGMVGKEGLDVKVVADMFGFPNSLAMIDALLEAKPINETITEITQQRMLEKHSDLVDPRKLELQIQEAIHNEARARFVAVELNTLSKAMRPIPFQVEAARQVAKDVLADKQLSEIRPSEYTRAEARALKETEKAMKKGDTKAAIKAKRSQLINNQLAKEAIEIHKEYNKAIREYKKFFKSDEKLTRKGKSQRNIDYINVGRVILSSYNLGPTVENADVYIENLRLYDEPLYTELEPMILNTRATKNQQGLKDLTYDEFLSFNDLMESLWYQSLRDQQIKLEGELVQIQPIIDTLNNRQDVIINRSKKLRDRRDNPIGTTQAVPKSYLFNKFFLEFKAKLRRFEPWADEMDGASNVQKGTGSAVLELEGGKLGDFYNTLWFPMKTALDEYRKAQTVFTKAYSDLVASVDFGDSEIIANEFEFVEEKSSAYTFGSESNGRGKVELLGAMLHTGNDSNKKKLLLGRRWGKLNEDGSLDTTHWDAFVKRMIDEGILTKNDYDFLQAVWDLNEKMLPLLQRTHRDTEGYYFKVVKATPILNRFGEFRGGYVPAKGDPNMTEVDIKEEINTMKMEFRNSLPKVENGMTKGRVENFYQPLSLHLGYMTKHIDDSLRYAYVQPVLQDTLKIINNKEFTKKLKIIDPVVKDEMIMPWLKAAATQKTYAPSGFSPSFDRVLQTQKRRAGLGIMFGNLPNAFQQLTGLFPALVKVKPRNLKNGLITYMKDREGTMQMIAEASPFMADRQKNLIFDIQDRLNELIINPNKFQKMQDWGKRHGYFLQQTFQGIVDSIVWMGTYNQVHENMPSNMSDADVFKEAIKQADANVRMTQDSLLPEDRAAFQNMNPIVQSVTQFTGYFNMIANLGYTQYRKLAKEELGFNNVGKNSEQLFYLYLYSVIMPAVIAGIIMRGLGGRIDDEDDDGYILDDIAMAALGDIANYTAGLVPIAGQLVLIPINQFNDKPWDDDIVSSPGIEALQDSIKSVAKIPVTLFQDGPSGIKGKQIRDVSTMINQFTGIPTTPLGRSLGYLRDVQRGDVTPKGPIDFLRGLITGKKGTGK